MISGLADMPTPRLCFSRTLTLRVINDARRTQEKELTLHTCCVFSCIIRELNLFYLGFHFFKFQPKAKYNWKPVSTVCSQGVGSFRFTPVKYATLSKAFLHLKETKQNKNLYSSLSLCSLHKMSSAFYNFDTQWWFLQFTISTSITFSYSQKNLCKFFLRTV